MGERREGERRKERVKERRKERRKENRKEGRKKNNLRGKRKIERVLSIGAREKCYKAGDVNNFRYY